MNEEHVLPSAYSSHTSESLLHFDDRPILEYLRLGDDHHPLPSADPITFLQQNQHLKCLPPHILSSFGSITTPKQRTSIPTVRNRRLKFVDSQPLELEFENARDKWPDLWKGPRDWRKIAEREKQDERAWAETRFLNGEKQHVGKLGSLLGEYAEEREAERIRASRRQILEEFIPEEEDSEDSEDAIHTAAPDDSPEEAKANFERLIREHFIYGLLDSHIYSYVDWSDQWDSDNDRFDEERWFDDEEESV
ncbi:hypothetical protein ACEPAF_3864 [Sanghuangporus sanghuang]